MISTNGSSGGGGSRVTMGSLDSITCLSKKWRGLMTLQRSAAVLTDRLTHAVNTPKCEPDSKEKKLC